MMLADVLREENIITDLKSRDKEDVLGDMVDDISPMVGHIDREKILKALLDREMLSTTGIGHGVAIPHGKIRGLPELKVFFGRSRKGVNFSSMDSLPVHLVFLILAPENSAAAHLKVLPPGWTALPPGAVCPGARPNTPKRKAAARPSGSRRGPNSLRMSHLHEARGGNSSTSRFGRLVGRPSTIREDLVRRGSDFGNRLSRRFRKGGRRAPRRPDRRGRTETKAKIRRASGSSSRDPELYRAPCDRLGDAAPRGLHEGPPHRGRILARVVLLEAPQLRFRRIEFPGLDEDDDPVEAEGQLPGLPVERLQVDFQGFKANGYRTGDFGKWHNGNDPDTPEYRAAFVEAFKNMPNKKFKGASA